MNSLADTDTSQWDLSHGGKLCLFSSCQLALIPKSPGSISSKSRKESRMKLRKRNCHEKETQSLTTAWEGFKVVRWKVQHFCCVISSYLRDWRASSLPPPQPLTQSLWSPETPVNKPKRHYRTDRSVESTRVMNASPLLCNCCEHYCVQST